MRSTHIVTALLLASVSLGYGMVRGAGPETALSPLSLPVESAAADESPEHAWRRQLAEEHGAEVAEAIQNRTVLVGMTLEQVLQAHGAPVRKDVIPPDAELWHYPDGEVAFADGKVTYVGLGKAQTPPRSPEPVPEDKAVPEPAEALVPTEGRAADMARVHTPGDGFLALRSEPTIRRGRRLVKIPHGTRLTLDECVTRPSDGPWCRTSFQGLVGWVSERYLIR